MTPTRTAADDHSDVRYYAHSGGSPEDRDQWHELAEHLDGTGARAAAFLRAVSGCDVGRVAGILHDLGKYSEEFQERLEGAPGRVNHSTAGAKIAIERYGERLGKMLAFCIAGHHAGLANGVNGDRVTALTDRLRERVPKLAPAWKREVELPDPHEVSTPLLRPRDTETNGFCAAFFVRMLFSALVDADWLDTEAYYDKLEGTSRPRGQHPPLRQLRNRLDAHLATLAASATANPLNHLRDEVLTHARRKAGEPPGVFSLTVPTGGGKTLTSLAFALDHALQHRLARIIYVIPYMSVIEQTAEVFRQALQDEAAGEPDFVVEHHSTFDERRVGQREARDKLRLAMENWDAPVVVTTAVQFSRACSPTSPRAAASCTTSPKAWSSWTRRRRFRSSTCVLAPPRWTN